MTTGSDLDGPRSSTHLGLHVGADWSVRCHSYPDSAPILAVNLGRTTLSVSAAGSAVTSDQVDFAYALLAAVNDYLIECEQLRFAALEAVESAEYRAA
ncbi:hypothetical protein [Parafrankia sp. EUN1f]|uniref:hypothetical protein n=1 Tax=Parafrankia sp. EUN1f TaxID=102897 RepID=UPI0001C43DCA|nr:hypothetical protein [Parafrankia sp. EUN1f]EFC85957.1 hypothetical protein FrEUN1fDRAFT_0934 [Parafrankia sp. EUN1f]